MLREKSKEFHDIGILYKLLRMEEIRGVFSGKSYIVIIDHNLNINVS